METTGPMPGGTPPVSPARADAGGGAWQVGQLLRAVTLSSSPGGQAVLQVGAQTVQGQSPIPLAVGQPVTLQVESLAPQPMLRILPPPGGDPLGDAIRTLLPKQGGLAPLLNQLAQLANGRTTVAPPLLQEASRHLLRQLPDSRGIGTAPGLRQAVTQSGLFLEARLQAARDGGPVRLDSDLKANLARLVQLVRNWPGASPGAAAGNRAPGVTPTAGSPPAPTPAGSPALPTTGASLPSPLLSGTAPLPPPGALPAGNQPPPVPGTPAQGSVPPGTGGQQAAPGHATPATLARGLRAATPLPAGAQAPAMAPTPSPATPASALARVLLGTGLGLPLPPPPPLRGQPPQPQARAAATAQALLSAPALRTELLQQVEASLARLQLHQLASLPQGRDTGMEWLLDLPVRRGEETDVWSMNIRREDERDGQDAERQGPLWTVRLAFDLPGLGPMQARVSLRGEQVSTWFWAARDETLPLLREHVRELRRELEANGLRVAELQCLRGSMPGDAQAMASRRPILDERI